MYLVITLEEFERKALKRPQKFAKERKTRICDFAFFCVLFEKLDAWSILNKTQSLYVTFRTSEFLSTPSIQKPYFTSFGSIIHVNPVFAVSFVM